MQRVARLNEMGKLAAALAHEINQPLAAAANFAEAATRLLPKDDETPGIDAAREAMREAADQAVHAGAIVRRLRSILMASDGDWRQEDLNALVREAVSLAMPDPQRQDVALRLDLAPALPAVEMDRVQIGQVVANLVRNAVEATEGGSRREVTVSTALAGQDRVALAVADTGQGLAPEIRGRIFQPFVTTKPEGMGVGLSISQAILEQHGGRLDCAPNPGGGTVFRFDLPMRREGTGPHE
jgi:two-component system sensor kinase FixL